MATDALPKFVGAWFELPRSTRGDDPELYRRAIEGHLLCFARDSGVRLAGDVTVECSEAPIVFIRGHVAWAGSAPVEDVA